MQSAMGREEVRDLPGDNIVITSRLEAPHRSLSLLHRAVIYMWDRNSAVQGVLTLCPGGGGGGHPALHCGGGGGGLHCAVYVGGGGGHLLGSLILSHPGHLLLTTNEHSAALKPDCTAQCEAHLVISRFVTVINLL